ncbi:DUF642 domain-containing protein, partial [Flavobacterium sp.]|uniref:beta strand repeat-containing protein n=1 Tax=Flavobacterium sp. TaxID=239 RepID=UPI00262CBF46
MKRILPFLERFSCLFNFKNTGFPISKNYILSFINIDRLQKVFYAKLKFFFIVFFFAFVTSATGQISQPTAWTKAYDTNSTLTYTGVNFAIANGSNRILVVAIASTFTDAGGSGTQADPTVITYGGVTLTKAVDNGETDGRMHTWLYYLKDNAVMNGTSRPLNVTGGAVSGSTLANMTVWYSVYAGVDQTPATYTTGNGFNNTSSNNSRAQLSSNMAVNANEQAVYISSIYNDNSGTLPSYTINSNWTSRGNNTGSFNTTGNTVSWRNEVASRTIPVSNTTDNAITSTLTPNGNIRYAMSAISLPGVPTITSLGSTSGCVGSTITINGTNLTGATAANVRIGGTPVASITSISSTQIVAVVGSGTTGLVTVTNASGTATSASTFTVNPAPTSSNAGVDQSGNSTSYTLSANTPTVGTGAWSIISGPNTSLTQFSNVSNPAAIFTPSVSGSFVLSWTITNGSCTSSDQIAITPCINNLITNGDFANGGTGWTFATTKGRYVETNPENIYFSTGNPGSTAELDSEASLRQTVTVTPGVSYTLSFVYALRGGATSPGAVDVKVIGGTTPMSTIFTTTSNIPSTETFTFTPSSTSIAIEFFNSLSGSSTLGTIIDNIVLVPSSQVTPSATTIPKGVFNTLASCAGTPVQLDVENVPSSGVTYSWTGTAGATFSATNIKNPIATFTNNGLNEATVTVTTAGGCISSSTTYVNININRTNGPTITTTATPAVVLAVCQSAGAQTTSMAYTATTNSPTSYRIDWNTLADQGSTAFTTGGSLTGIVVPAGTPAGTYTGTMIVTNANCSSTKAISLTVGKTASSASSSPTLCQNSLMTPITHTTIGTTSIGSPSGLPTGVSATWASNTITISGTPTQSGTFNYSIPLIGSCTITVNATGTITVNPLPAAPTVGTITNVTCSSTTGSVVLSDLQNGWTITQSGTAPGSYTSSGTSYTVTGLAVGDYTFTVKNGTCTSASTPNVSIIDASSATWNGSGWVGSIAPDATKNIIIASSLGSPFAANLTCCSLTINTGVTATVPSGVTLTITNAVTTNGQLIFENNASLVQTTNATNTGAIEYRRISSPMKNFDFTYWASPVTGQNIVALSPNTLADKYFYFDPQSSGDGWILYNNPTTSTMIPGVGYIIRVPKPNFWPVPTASNWAQPVAFKGVPNNGDYTFTAGAGQFNLIGNPYPSAIDADKFINANSGIINGALYFWTHNTAIAKSGSSYVYTTDDYASYTLTGSTGTEGSGNFTPEVWVDANNNLVVESGEYVDLNGNGVLDKGLEWIDSNNNNIRDVGEWTDSNNNGKVDLAPVEVISNKPLGMIAAGQSFFVESQPTPTATQFVFNNSMRATGNNSQFFKQVNTKKSTKLEKNRIWLNLTNSGGAFKQLLVGYITGATNDWDNLYDGSTFDGQEFVDFYSVNQGKNLTIQGRALPFENTDVVPLGYR